VKKSLPKGIGKKNWDNDFHGACVRCFSYQSFIIHGRKFSFKALRQLSLEISILLYMMCLFLFTKYLIIITNRYQRHMTSFNKSIYYQNRNIFHLWKPNCERIFLVHFYACKIFHARENNKNSLGEEKWKEKFHVKK
jgi:hypothetical protein